MNELNDKLDELTDLYIMTKKMINVKKKYIVETRKNNNVKVFFDQDSNFLFRISIQDNNSIYFEISSMVYNKLMRGKKNRLIFKDWTLGSAYFFDLDEFEDFFYKIVIVKM